MPAIEIGAEAALPATRPSLLKSLGLLVGIIVLIGGYIALCLAIGNTEFYSGFLFLLCWSALEHGKVEKLPQVVMGAAFGLGLGYLHKILVVDATGGLIFVAVILPVIYCHLTGWLPLLVNFTAMIFLTVLTIPHIQGHGDFRDTAIALVLSVVYFGLVLGVSRRFANRHAP